jgi:hypothetical protein
MIHFQVLEILEQTKLQNTSRKEIIKIISEINEIESKRIIKNDQ